MLNFFEKKVPAFLQSEATECGLSCLGMIAYYHGFKSNMPEIRRMYKVSNDGMTLNDLIQFSERLELIARPVRAELDVLKNLKLPCILHWKLDHFVVLTKIKANKFYINDPARGEVVLSISEVSNLFTGIAIEFTPSSSFKAAKAPPNIRVSNLFSRISGFKRSILLAFLISILLQTLILAGPYYIQIVMDEVVSANNRSLLVVLGFGFTLILFFEVITQILRSFAILHLSQHMNYQMTSNLFRHLIGLPINFFSSRNLGDIVSRFSSIHDVRALLTNGLVEALLDGITAVFTLIMLAYYSVSLTITVLCIAFLYLVIRLGMYASYRKKNLQEVESIARENSYFMESIRSVQTIKLCGMERTVENIWQALMSQSINDNIAISKHQISYGAINRMLFGLGNIIVIGLAATQIISTEITIGMFFAFMAYKQNFMGKIANLIEKFIEYKMLSLSMERLSDIICTEKEDLKTPLGSVTDVKGAISFDQLSFRYGENSRNIIHQLSFRIEEGEFVSITGPSGCGKSTIFKLILGIEKPESGDILIDGTDLCNMNVQNFRGQVSAVMQNDSLMSGNIEQNISAFDEFPDKDLIVQCAKLACIHDDIEFMRMGYKTHIGELGSSLSGGQQQRILIARALYRKPKILLLDEATSHLNIELESKINENLRSLGMTRISIAHRPDTINAADRIVNISPCC